MDDDPDLVEELAEQADLLFDEGRRDDAVARCRRLIEHLEDEAEDDEWAAEVIARARRGIAYADYDRGCDLQDEGRGAEAEAAYREAIAGGYDAAWLNLGILLQGVRGREAEEEAALREALNCDDEDVAPWAALELGLVLIHRGDPDGARACLELAAEQGAPETSFQATAHLAYLAAARRDRAELVARVRTMAAARDEDDVDLTRAAPLLARVPFLLVGGRLTGRPWRRFQRARWEAGRRRRARRLFG